MMVMVAEIPGSTPHQAAQATSYEWAAHHITHLSCVLAGEREAEYFHQTCTFPNLAQWLTITSLEIQSQTRDAASKS